MSYIRIPRKSEGRLPSIPSLDEVPTPIEVTMWKCRRQVFGTLVVCLGAFTVGAVFAWAAVALPDLKAQNKIFPGEGSEAAVASLFIFGAILCGPVAGYAMLKLGRKIATLCFAILFSIGWAIIPAANFVDSRTGSETMLCIGRFLTGFAGAGCLIITPVYVREMSDDGVRTAMGSMVPLILVLGNTFCYAIGNFIDWWILSILIMLVPITLSILMIFIPNTPRHFLTVGKVEEARKAMDWLTHGFEPEERERIFKKVKRGVDFLSESTNRAMKRSERKQQERRKKLRLSSKPVLHPLIISILLVFFQQATGTNVVGTFTTEILDRGKEFITVDVATLLVGIIFFVAVLAATLVVERWGRRPLLLGGTAVMFITLIMLGVYFHYDYWGEKDPQLRTYLHTNFAWIPVLCCNIFIGSYAMGLGSVTWIMASEINHPDFQEIAGTLDSLTYWLTAFISTVTTPSLRNAIHYHWCFYIYGIFTFIAFFYIYFFIYETKGKTTEEIMAHYKGTLYNPDEDLEGDSESIGSIRKRASGKGSHAHNRSSKGSAKAAGDRRWSTGSDWSTAELETLYETSSHDIAT